jgi:hypothetical protein
MTYRDKAAQLTKLKNLNELEHKKLKTDGALNHRLWSDKAYEHEELVEKFRTEAKEHYFWHQGAKCCYCSMELQPHGRVFDAEHILDKSSFPEFMFHPENLAVACVICNTHKSTKSVLSVNNLRPRYIPTERDDYKILHPHLDEWNHHLYFDDIGRILPVNGSSKGVNTISICSIDGINFMRLAQKFSPSSRMNAYELMCKVVAYTNPRKIEDALTVMQVLAEQSPDAIAVVAILKEKVSQMQAQRAAEAVTAADPVNPDNENDMS